jgi:hypothetical protein
MVHAKQFIPTLIQSIIGLNLSCCLHRGETANINFVVFGLKLAWSSALKVTTAFSFFLFFFYSCCCAVHVAKPLVFRCSVMWVIVCLSVFFYFCRHDIAEILPKLALNTNQSINLLLQ